MLFAKSKGRLSGFERDRQSFLAFIIGILYDDKVKRTSLRRFDMTIMGLSDLTWLSMIAFLLCIGFGLYMVKTKKPGIVRSVRDTARYKDSEKFAEKGGKLIIAYSLSWLVMLVASFFSDVVSILIGVVGLIVFGYFWKKMNDEYGPV